MTNDESVCIYAILSNSLFSMCGWTTNPVLFRDYIRQELSAVDKEAMFGGESPSIVIRRYQSIDEFFKTPFIVDDTEFFFDYELELNYYTTWAPDVTFIETLCRMQGMYDSGEMTFSICEELCTAFKFFEMIQGYVIDPEIQYQFNRFVRLIRFYIWAYQMLEDTRFDSDIIRQHPFFNEYPEEFSWIEEVAYIEIISSEMIYAASLGYPEIDDKISRIYRHSDKSEDAYE